ncbi:MAG: NUDIX hydrolase [Cytophagales bacterium]|nr:NUDIX hydrolase [Cytophagales bacterium]
MKLFINNVRVKFLDRKTSLKNKKIDMTISTYTPLDVNKVFGNILVNDANNMQVHAMLKILEMKKFAKIKSITFLSADVRDTETFIKKQFKIIKAAGGVVVKDDRILCIFRLGFWDLPKGKLDDKENINQCAEREVYEECGVKAEIVTKLCTTWHSYTDKDKPSLKKTTWFVMNCVNDHGMKPQIEEDITDIKWIHQDEIKKYYSGSYNSIKYVIKKYLKIADEVTEEL